MKAASFGLPNILKNKEVFFGAKAKLVEGFKGFAGRLEYVLVK